jgi:hypothetical protein
MKLISLKKILVILYVTFLECYTLKSMIHELPVAVITDAVVVNAVDAAVVDAIVVDDAVVDAIVVCIWLPPNFSMVSVILYGSVNIYSRLPFYSFIH